jgi:hypothetical protein
MSKTLDSDIVEFVHWYRHQRHFPDTGSEDTMESHMMMTMAPVRVREGFKKVYESFERPSNRFVDVDEF